MRGRNERKGSLSFLSAGEGRTEGEQGKRQEHPSPAHALRLATLSRFGRKKEKSTVCLLEPAQIFRAALPEERRLWRDLAGDRRAGSSLDHLAHLHEPAEPQPWCSASVPWVICLIQISVPGFLVKALSAGQLMATRVIAGSRSPGASGPAPRAATNRQCRLCIADRPLEHPQCCAADDRVARSASGQ